MTGFTKTLQRLGQASLTGAVLMSGFAFSQPADAVSANNRFFQDYSWCDAQMLGKFWRIGPGEAKFDAGEMILDGEQSLVENKLAYARQDYSGQGLCSFSNEGYSYDDMVAVADYWQSRSVFEAKTSINSKLEAGLHREVENIVKSARQEAEQTARRTEKIAFQSLSRDGKTLGYFVRHSDGSWVEQSASGETLFVFREVDHNPLMTTLVDESRGLNVYLDYHFSQVQYRFSSDQGAPQALYAMSF